MILTSNTTKPLYEEEVDVLTMHEDPCNLIVWNDEVNTFEWVIDTLMEVCKHSREQAEQPGSHLASRLCGGGPGMQSSRPPSRTWHSAGILYLSANVLRKLGSL